METIFLRIFSSAQLLFMVMQSGSIFTKFIHHFFSYFPETFSTMSRLLWEGSWQIISAVTLFLFSAENTEYYAKNNFQISMLFLLVYSIHIFKSNLLIAGNSCLPLVWFCFQNAANRIGATFPSRVSEFTLVSYQFLVTGNH